MSERQYGMTALDLHDTLVMGKLQIEARSIPYTGPYPATRIKITTEAHNNKEKIARIKHVYLGLSQVMVHKAPDQATFSTSIF